MNKFEVSTVLSFEDRKAIVDGVVSAIRPLLEPRPAFVSADAMSEFASISPATLDRLRRAGKIPSVKVGHRRLYNPERVIAALEAES